MNPSKIKYSVLALFLSLNGACYAQIHGGVDTTQYPFTKITIASEPDYPPYCIVDQNGKPAGFSIDLFRAAAKAVNIEIVMKIGIWSKIKQDLADGNIDALPLVGRTPDRENLYGFSMPYITLHGAIFVREGTTNIKTIEDLSDKQIIVMKGDNSEEFVRRNKVSNHIITTNTFAEAFKLLAAGEFDAIITQHILGLQLIKDLDINTIKPLEIPLDNFRQDFCFAVRKGNNALLSRLNEGLSIVIANGIYDKIRLKWFGPVYKEKLSFKQIAWIVIYTFIPLILLFSVISIFILRREVKRKTKILQHEINEHKKTVLSLHGQQLLLADMERTAKVGGWEYDAESQKVTWTNGVYNIYGISSADFDSSEINNDLSYYHPDDRKELETAFQQTLEKGVPYDLKLRLQTSDNSSKWVRTSGRAEFIDGKVVRIFGNIIDITEQKLIEDDFWKLKNELEIIIADRTKELNEKVEKLDKSQMAMLYMVEDLNSISGDLKQEHQRLEAANKELEAFSYSVSHDLRSPLRALDGFARILLEDYSSSLDAEGNRLLQVITDNAKKMGILIDDLLAFSRLNRQEMKASTIDMQTLVKTVYNDLVPEVDKETIEFNLQNIPVSYGDISLMRQVWVNLIGNAIKFSSNKSSRIIEVGCNTEVTENIYYVKDNGAGFDMAYSNKLFGVFQRLHSTKEFDGTGVGLAIVQRIVHRLKGRVWAEGKVNEGATFYFALPNRE